MFLLWFDDSKRPTAQKIAAAIARYTERYGHAPSVVLTCPGECEDVPGVEVRAAEHVRQFNYWVGMVENTQGVYQ